MCVWQRVQVCVYASINYTHSSHLKLASVKYMSIKCSNRFWLHADTLTHSHTHISAKWACSALHSWISFIGFVTFNHHFRVRFIILSSPLSIFHSFSLHFSLSISRSHPISDFLRLISVKSGFIAHKIFTTHTYASTHNTFAHSQSFSIHYVCSHTWDTHTSRISKSVWERKKITKRKKERKINVPSIASQ